MTTNIKSSWMKLENIDTQELKNLIVQDYNERTNHLIEASVLMALVCLQLTRTEIRVILLLNSIVSYNYGKSPSGAGIWVTNRGLLKHLQVSEYWLNKVKYSLLRKNILIKNTTGEFEINYDADKWKAKRE